MRPVHWFRFKVRCPRRFSTGLDKLPAKASTHSSVFRQSAAERRPDSVLTPLGPQTSGRSAVLLHREAISKLDALFFRLDRRGSSVHGLHGASRQASGRVPANSGELAALGSKSDGRASDRCEGTQRRTALPDERRQSTTTFDLRGYVRERLIQYLQEHYPQALARIRCEVSLVDASSKGIAHSASQRPDA
jgi:hypothetical protein